MKKRKKVALYDPYLDTLGGGEKHILSILQILEEEGYDIDIFWDEDVQDEFKSRLNIKFDYVITFQPNIFKKRGSLLKKVRQLSQYDFLFYVTDGSYFFSSANQNYIFAMVPNKNLYDINFKNRLKTSNYNFISNSDFTQKWLKKWGINSKVIKPYIDDEFLRTPIDISKKEKMILSVGRFFGHLHSKKQGVQIKIFQDAKKKHPELKDFKLVIAGGLKNEDKPYFEKLKKIIDKDRSIILKPNISFDELFDLYKRSMIFWHFAGYGVDENQHPEQVEHLGITPLEAMATHNLTFCVNAGGPKEYIQDGKNGYLFSTNKELLNKTLKAIKNPPRRIQQEARETVRKNFSKRVFRETVLKILLNK